MIPAPRWDRVKQLFDGAVALAGAERAAFLAEACGGDAALREEVESLLASHEQAGPFLADTAAGPPGEDPAEPVAGSRLGAYRVLGLIGRGGMGDVYRAVRDDDHFKKVVALKLVRREMATELMMTRFRAERQILAGLEHPGIARLLDGGATEDGRPFLAMEHVEGTRIDVHCREGRLPTRERAELFRSVCAAVQYAHQNLVVHRDLKPANILVTSEGVPKLLDFGVAKLIDPSASGEATGTLFGAMTPAYASPEQFRGEAITTATDVYSLGVVLYELLTGGSPYRITSGAPLALQQAICEQEPERPRAAEDLDAIVLKALRKSPSRRYPTVEAFSEDLRRYLEGLPVSARKGTVRYLTGKFVRRHQAKVALSALLVAMAVGFVINRSVQARRLAQERDKAERVAAFLVDLFKVSDPSEAHGNTVTAREVLDKGASRIGAELKGEPEVQAALMDTMGRVYMNLGLYQRATPLLEEALRTRRRLLGPEHPDVAASLNTLGNILYDKGDYAGAEALYREALAMRRRLLGSEHLDVARTLNNLSILVQNRGDYPAAEALHREAMTMKRKLLGAEHLDVARSQNNLALVLHRKGDHAGAEALHRQALATKRKLQGRVHPDVGRSLNNLANVMHDRGDYAEAEALYRESLAMDRQLLGSEHSDVGIDLNNIGNVLRLKGDAAGAEALHREALALRRKVLGHDHADVAQSLYSLAEALHDQRDHAAAEPLYREALAMREKLLGPTHADVAESLTALAEVLSERGRCAEAEPLIRQALDIQGKVLPPAHPEVAHAQSVLGACLTAAGRFAEAEPLLRGSHAYLQAKLGERSHVTREAAARVARLYEAWGKREIAAAYRPAR